ncbi:prepilin-type N-terminal cleavage/methylation domain-containing protein [Rheinheimera soli]|uniref:prepilin-type N-terminal cleavage/methylation domain-containing protein n=1 Tax=Rheinheimera soli TaxID=443616 RepID=UPI001E34767A|nr:prepilin-type N-terminal cleavage/methylation domain-containing protein [Rheinheimera soli]
MPNASGFTLTEVLISLLLLCLTGLGALSASLYARQQVIMATQQTIALSLTTELASRMASHDSSAGYYDGIHPLWATAESAECTENHSCDAEQLSQFHLYSTLSASGHPQSLQLLQQPALCIRQQADQKLVQLSWRSQAKVQIQRPTSVCDLSPNRLQVSVVVP